MEIKIRKGKPDNLRKAEPAQASIEDLIKRVEALEKEVVQLKARQK